MNERFLESDMAWLAGHGMKQGALVFLSVHVLYGVYIKQCILAHSFRFPLSYYQLAVTALPKLLFPSHSSLSLALNPKSESK
jgi:hypothetical protein